MFVFWKYAKGYRQSWTTVLIMVIYLVIYLVGHPNHEGDRRWPYGSSDTAGVHKKPISVDCNFCSCALKALTEVTFSTLAGSLFHLLTTLSEKKWSLRSLFDRLLFSFSEWPRVLVSARNSNNVVAGRVDRPFTILYTSIMSALLRRSSR